MMQRNGANHPNPRPKTGIIDTFTMDTITRIGTYITALTIPIPTRIIDIMDIGIKKAPVKTKIKWILDYTAL
jgi:hypothetical protein